MVSSFLKFVPKKIVFAAETNASSLKRKFKKAKTAKHRN